MDEILKYLAGGVIALAIFFLFKPRGGEVEPVIIETVETDTCLIKSTEIVYLDKPDIEIEYIRDTVIIDYEPKIRGYRALIPFLHGNVSLRGEVLGEVLKMKAEGDFDYPVITNTITREIRIHEPEKVRVWADLEGGDGFAGGLRVEVGKNALGYSRDLDGGNRIKYSRMIFQFKR